MRKQLLLSMTFLVILLGCNSKKSKDVTILCWSTDFSDYPQFLNGKVKEIKENMYWVVEKNGQIQKGALLTLKEHKDSGIIQDFHSFFNAKGVLLRNDFLGDNSQIRWSHVNEINNERVIKEYWVKNDSTTGYALFNYDQIGFLSFITLHWNSQVDSSYNYKLDIRCDANGNMIQMRTFNFRNAFTGWTKYEWNESGRMTQVSYLTKDSLTLKIGITYNDHGFYDKIKSYNGNGKVIFDGTISYTYDEKGNYVKAVWYKSGKSWVIEERNYIYY